QVSDNCDIVDPANAGKFGDRSPLVESLNVTIAGAADPRGPLGTTVAYPVNNCHVEQAWLTQLKFLGSYTVPKIDVQIGAAYQNIPGIELYSIYQAPNSDLQRPENIVNGVNTGGLGGLP